MLFVNPSYMGMFYFVAVKVSENLGTFRKGEQRTKEISTAER